MTRSSKPTVAIGSRPASSARAGPAPVSSAGSPPRREQQHRAGQRDRRRTPDRAVAHRARADPEAGADHEHGEHEGEPEGQRGERRGQRQQQSGAPRGPPPTVGLGIGEAERRVSQPRQHGRGDHDAEPAQPPGAARGRDQRVGRGAEEEQPGWAGPGASSSRPTTRRKRHEPQNERGTASTSSRLTVPVGPTTEPSSASGRRYAGAGTAVPWPSACCDSTWNRHHCADRLGGGRQGATGDRAERLARADQGEHHEQRAAQRDRVGEEPRDPALLLGPRVLLVDDPDRLAGGDPPPLGDVGGLVGGGRGQVADEVEAVPVGHPGRRQQRFHVDRLRARRRTPDPSVAAGAHQQPRAAVERRERGELVERLADLPDQQQPDHPDQRPEAEPEHPPRQRPAAGVDQQRVEGRAALLVVDVAAGQRGPAYAAVGGLDVEDHGLRDDQGPVAGGGGAPAEVDVVAEDRHLLVEAAELLQHRAAHQHPGGVDREDRTARRRAGPGRTRRARGRSRGGRCPRW